LFLRHSDRGITPSLSSAATVGQITEVFTKNRDFLGVCSRLLFGFSDYIAELISKVGKWLDFDDRKTGATANIDPRPSFVIIGSRIGNKPP